MMLVFSVNVWRSSGTLEPAGSQPGAPVWNSPNASP
jgi:hypothetical protein